MPSPTTSVEELMPCMKKPCVANKGKEKASLRSSSVWDDANLALTKAYDLFTANELKVLSRVLSNELVGRHVHRLIRVIFLCNLLFTFFFLYMVLTVGSSFQVLGEIVHITSEYLSQEARVLSAESKVKSLEKDCAKLMRDLIKVMDEVNSLKEKAKALSDDLKAERQLMREKNE